MKNSHIYGRLLEVLRPAGTAEGGCLLGTVEEWSPLAVRVGETVVTQNLYRLEGVEFRPVDVGAAVALLPCEDGLLILHRVRGGDV